MSAPKSARGPHAPWFTACWLAGTSLLYVALVPEDGQLPSGIRDAVSLTPIRVFEEPWRALTSLVGIVFERDAVQFAYVAFLYGLGVPAFEWREGWRRSAIVFVGGGLASVLLVTFLVFLPLHLLVPTNGMVEFAVSRSYSGGSTGAFAILGALAGVVASTRARVAILAGALAWEAYIWGSYYDFAQLISLYHVAALFTGFWIVRARWFARVA